MRGTLATSFMQKFTIIQLIILIALLISCKPQVLNDKLKIYGYSIGDTLTGDFNVIKRYGPYFSDAKYSDDSALIVYLIGNHISSFHLSLINKEFDNYVKLIQNGMNQSPIHYIGDSLHGVKLIHKIEHFYWYDSITFNEYSLIRNLDSMNLCNLSISNDSIRESLCIRFIDDYNIKEEKIEFMVFE